MNETGVILETEDSLQPRYERAIFPIKNFKKGN